MAVSCPECGEIGDINQTTEPDEQGIAEYYCGECGCYFTELAPEFQEDEDQNQ